MPPHAAAPTVLFPPVVASRWQRSGPLTKRESGRPTSAGANPSTKVESHRARRDDFVCVGMYSGQRSLSELREVFLGAENQVDHFLVVNGEGIVGWRLAGVISECGRELGEIVVAARADFIRSDGAIIE